ncbi:MAG: sigma 54-interacting transcriptional regulator [Planctomycetes bacterium]|nr:sigma 54-interacting transcriptional regulator [Planctomycetota bacterium]
MNPALTPDALTPDDLARVGTPASFLEAIIETMAEGVMTIDLDGTITSWNAGAQRITGFTRADVLGRPCGVIPGLDRGCQAACLTEGGGCPLVERGELRNVECRVLARDGRERVLLKNVCVLRDPAGAPIGGVESFSDITELRAAKAALESLRRELEERHGIPGLVGKGRRMRDLHALVERAADSTASVLVQGESGTGKELVAEALHRLSPRAGRPFVKVSCSALAETLLESELFGHARGSFTGAYADKVGRFEAASGGTLLLDEIGDLDPGLQLKLLRVLQEKEFERVGETRPRRADVRVISATNRDLRALVRGGRFREDLFYRLNVVSLTLPPLRERREDVPTLVEHFVRRYRAETGRGITGCSREALAALVVHDWPGNVRELQHAIEYAFVVAHGPWIDLLDLPEEVRKGDEHVLAARHRPGPASAPDTPEAERARLLDVLRDTCGNRAKAARVLGMSRTTLWKLARRHGLARGRDGNGNGNSAPADEA